MDFAGELISWYNKNKRDLPWRKTQNPYKIWLSEIILQQTRVDQGLPYYQAFTSRYPDIHALASAKEKDVMKTWEGLGYYSRARNLHASARYVSKELKGKFPKNYEALLKLKGVGDYTASAISSICYGEVQPVVDGNVFRFLSRYFGIVTPIDSPSAKREFKEIAAQLIPHDNPGTFNQAMMEFGARQCVPKNPDCAGCVFAVSCIARKKKLVGSLPVKSRKTKISKREMNYLILFDDNHTFIRNRSSNDIWQGLNEFILSEKELPEKLTSNSLARYWKKQCGIKGLRNLTIHPLIIHKLSHRNLHIRFFTANASEPTRLNGYKRVRADRASKSAFPVVIARKFREVITQV